MAETIHVRLVGSPISTNRRVRETLRGLGLTRVGRERELERTPMVEGMLRKVCHLVQVKDKQGKEKD
jgi:large subunit ribosomal protein L30